MAKPKKTPWMNPQCAAEILGCSRRTVTNAIALGRLDATWFRAKAGRMFPILHERDVKRFRAARTASAKLMEKARTTLTG